MQRGFSSIGIVLIILLVLGVGSGSYFFGKNQTPITSKPIPVISPYATITSPPAPTEDPKDPNSKVFISQDLGISFNYANKDGGINGSSIGVKQVGNRVYVYSVSFGKPEDGQYVEVFSKNKDQSLVDAIKEKILKGYSLDDCQLKGITVPFKGQSYPSSYELAEITVSYSQQEDLDKAQEKVQKCPATYISFMGINYFLSDSNHPDKFVHFSIGQYGIDSGIDDKLWQTTLKFLP